MGLPYPVQLLPQNEDGDEFWIAEILDLPGCMTDGATPDEALENIEEAKRLWIEAILEDGFEVPEPAQLRDYSGKLLVRMPKSVHQGLAVQAKLEGVSLNQYVVSLLSNVRHIRERAREDKATLARLADEIETLRAMVEGLAIQSGVVPLASSRNS